MSKAPLDTIVCPTIRNDPYTSPSDAQLAFRAVAFRMRYADPPGLAIGLRGNRLVRQGHSAWRKGKRERG